MVKGLLRFAVIWALSMLVTPYLERFFSRLASRAPRDSLLEEFLQELSGQYSSSMIKSVGETLSEMVFGARK